MQLRPIRADEVPVFAGCTGDAQQIQQVQAYIEQMFAAGTMRPEWCFIAVDSDERTLGRVAFWTLPDNERPLDIVLFDVDWQSNAQSTGQAVLAQVLERARELGADNIGYALDDPPSAPHFQHHLEERLALLKKAGFELARATYRFELPDEPSPAQSVLLNYRNLEEVGEAAFIEAIALVSEGSFDQRIAADRAREHLSIEDRKR